MYASGFRSAMVCLLLYVARCTLARWYRQHANVQPGRMAIDKLTDPLASHARFVVAHSAGRVYARKWRPFSLPLQLLGYQHPAQHFADRRLGQLSSKLHQLWHLVGCEARTAERDNLFFKRVLAGLRNDIGFDCLATVWIG